MKTIIHKPIANIFSSSKKTKEKETRKDKKIIIDYREKNCLVPSELKRLGFDPEIKELKVADYIVKDTAIERKTISDFLGSMINQRLMNQIEELKQYENRLLIVEGTGEKEIYSQNVNENAIRGFILSITLKHKIPLIFTKDSEDTAKFMDTLYKKREKETRLNPKKKTLDKKEQLQFVIESFPGIGPKKSKELLEKFGSIQNIINAPLEDLKEILGKKADVLIEIISRGY
jgi:DNA excision repair protein ERCC-4